MRVSIEKQNDSQVFSNSNYFSIIYFGKMRFAASTENNSDFVIEEFAVEREKRERKKGGRKRARARWQNVASSVHDVI